MAETITLVQGDIVRMNADAIVNAANITLLGGGGVDGAIHKAAGPRLLEECRRLGGCSVGHSKITKGYDIPAKYIIHTATPIWRGGYAAEIIDLGLCYTSALDLAREHNLKTVAFPSLSTGIHGFPLERAIPVAVAAVNSYIENFDGFDEIRFVCYTPDLALHYYQEMRSKAVPFEEA